MCSGDILYVIVNLWLASMNLIRGFIAPGSPSNVSNVIPLPSLLKLLSSAQLSCA